MASTTQAKTNEAMSAAWLRLGAAPSGCGCEDVCEAADGRLEPDGEDEAEARAEDSGRADGGWEVRAEADGAAAGA